MCLLTMRKKIMEALMFFFFASQMLYISETVTVLRGSPRIYSSSIRKLICISEDDGGALVWNDNLNWRYYKNNRHNNNRFFNLNGGVPNCEINCKMNADEDCLKSWVQQDWSLTNSLKTPMGPVFDQRWEEFQEYANDLEDRYDYVNLENITAMLSISIRGSNNAHILLCNGTNYNRDLCYWIIIGGWDNTLSVIRKCATGVPAAGEFPELNSDCSKAQVSFKHMPLSAIEWRSFVIMWNSVTRNISVYDTDNVIMTYEDVEKPEFSSIDYHMFIRSNREILFRFHIYNFLHTTLDSAVLTSPIVQVGNETICVQMLIGLCAECDAHVVLRDSTNYKVLETVIAMGSSKAAHGLPMWQSVQIKKNLSTTSYTNVIIQVIPKLNTPSFNPLWAIANVRRCPTNNSLRWSYMINNQDWENYDKGYFWPNATCQKLFYNNHIVVNSISDAKPDMKLDRVDCPQGKTGPQCLISCEIDLDSYLDCKETAICYKDGCTCLPGYSESTCSKSCESYTYGYGCKKKCGACRDKTSINVRSPCNKITGLCYNGCQNFYIPPLCQLKIDNLDQPVINFANSTNIQAIIPFKWKKEYEEIPISYYCLIGQIGSNHIIYLSLMRVFPNMTQLIGNFENLAPGTTYEINCCLNVAGSQIYSPWQNAETDCNPVEGFDVKPGETSLRIDWYNNNDQLYRCPANWYRLIVRNIDTDEQVINEQVTYLPRNLSQLTSYTSFNVSIFHKNVKLFSQQIRTLESVPSRVLDLRVMISSNTLTVIWRPPDQPNGKIVRYEVILKIKEYYGCKDLKLPTPDNHIITKSTNHTTIKIPNLSPYVSYSVQVIAHNSRYNSMDTEINFDTDISEIPTEVFSQLKVQGWKLSWHPPEDCTTISGPIKAKIKIRGISNAVKDRIIITKNTVSYSLDLGKIEPKLHGVERYMATVYVIRDYTSLENVFAYQEYEFETPPTAPPNVINLEVVETDTRQVPAIIHLRWQSPRPPLNGKLHYYTIQSCTINRRKQKNCLSIKVQLNEFCDLWDNYICQTIQEPSRSAEIQVLVYNMNVTEPSPSVFVTDQMLSNTTPDPPENYTFTINDNSIIELKWYHPWKTGGHLQSFHIWIQEISSNLKKQRLVSRSLRNDVYEYPVAHYMRNYSERLYLFPSTQYRICIKAVTVANVASEPECVKIQTPSTIGFDGDLKVMVNTFYSTISLNIPPVLNDTDDSKMHIIVKGPNVCKQHSEVPENLRSQANVKMYDIAWQAAEVSTSDLAGKLFIVGDDQIYGGAKNCPLKPQESYEIVIIVTERSSSNKPIMLAKSISIGEIPPKHHEAWIIPIILFLVVAGAAFYLYRRKKQKSTKQSMQDEMVLSQNIENYEHETKSVISNSKQELSTPSDRQSLSRATTPEVPPLAVEKKNEETVKEITSLTKVKDFEDYVREAIQSGLLDKQYETFPRGQTRPWDYGKLPQNKSKNRYGNLIAYDETRVILKKLPDDAYSDYINANYITGYKKEKRYIATQGPKPNTVIDFWRMIWQENVLIICMLANVIENGKTKCEQYWPDIGKKKKYGDVIVLNAKHNVFADYCFRTFQVTWGEETRKIEHLHYTAWPDHGVPLYTHSVVTYLKKLLATPPGNGPVVVHCSAGVGRTGTIILCDICLHRAAAEGLVDVFAETASIRSERANMVDNKQQYLLAHLALVECLLSIPTTLPCNDLLPTRIKELKKQLSIQQQRLQNIAWQDEALRQFTSPPSLSERNRAKNRFPELISDKVSRIYLKRYPASDEDSDYLSAVYVDGIRHQNQYLATQLPMPSTVNDFWRMIAEFKVELILMLQSPDLQDPTCCVIAPASGEFKPTPYLNITVKEVVEFEYYTSQKLLLVDNSEKPSREQFVTILCLTEWKSGRNQPPPPVMTMVTLWQAAERIARGDGPTVTLCHDGVTGCGLYLALSFLLERMAVERECDVCLAVRAVRRSRPDFVRSLEHLEFLYDAAVTYLEYFETYANFS
ncbi:Receptor-type tyrosine-protein phosphatase mu [Formica fusca]